MREWLRRFRHRLRHSHEDADLREEMEAHRALRQDQLEREGMSAGEAVRASRRALGNLTLAREDARDVWVIRWIDALRQDVRNGLRILIKHRGVTATAVVSLALGIGANTAVFSLIDGILLKPLPYAEPRRLVMIDMAPQGRPNETSSATIPEYVAWQAHAALFEGMTTSFQMAGTLGADGVTSLAETVLLEKVRASLFDVLGVPPAIGRAFRPDEEQVDAPAPVAILSDEFWTRRYARDPDILNRSIRLNGIPTTIVGVMPPKFAFLMGKTDLFTPLSFNSPQLRGTARVFPVAARLKPGVTIAQAHAEMDALVPQLEARLPAPSKGWRARVQPLHQAMRGDFRLPLAMLQSIVAFVLLIACGNVAGLLLARAASRRTEIAVRTAIGAGRGRLIRQLLTESAVLALMGGTVGVGVGWALSRLLVTMSATFVPSLPAASIDLRVLAFALAVSLVTGLLFGALPALQASRTDLVHSLKSSTRGAADVFGRQRIRSAVVIAQVALAFVLLVGAGLALRSFVRLVTGDLGGDPRSVLRVDVAFRGMLRQAGTVSGYPLGDVNPKVNQTIEQITGRLLAVRGVQSAAGASLPPFTRPGPGDRIQHRWPADREHRGAACGDECRVPGGHARVFLDDEDPDGGGPGVRWARHRDRSVGHRDQRRDGGPLLAGDESGW